MPRRLQIAPKDKRDLRRRYARGETPSDLAQSRSDLGLSVDQLSNLITREGWAKQKGEIEQVRRRAASEVLAQVREDTSSDLEQILRSVHKGLATDATVLEDAWGLAEDAAGASALQRAKTLHLNRLLRFHGLDLPQTQSPAENRAALLAVVYSRYPCAEAHPRGEGAAIDVTPTEGDQSQEGLTLEFEDD